MRTYVFIDASNLFYGGEKSLGWKIDYQRLFQYLKEKYQAQKIFYFGGVEIHNFPYNYQKNDTVPISKLEEYISELIENKGDMFDEAQLLLLSRHVRRVRFYINLKNFGYELYLKPVKLYEQEDGSTKRKANCDVEMAFHIMEKKDVFDRAIILSGDGDFLPVLKHLQKNGKNVLVLARAPRTAKEIRQFAGPTFLDFEYLRERIKMR